MRIRQVNRDIHDKFCQEAEKEFCRPWVLNGIMVLFCARSEDRATLESDPSAVHVVKWLGCACCLRVLHKDFSNPIPNSGIKFSDR